MHTTPEATAKPAAPLRELLLRYDRPGPRYTSYPTALEFHEGVGSEQAVACLERAAQQTADPFSVYVHLPFCQERCLYCACNVVITREPAVRDHYLDALFAEIRRVGEHVGERRRVSQLHLGGGTPTAYSPAELDELCRCLRSVFDLDPKAECSVEVDPRVTHAEHLCALADHGFSRVSLGVQDLDPVVQAAVGRIQPLEQTVATIGQARALGYTSVNLDLIYGLPLQSAAGFQRTLDQVAALLPDRIAVYSYAHVPWMKAQQRRFREADLLGPDLKLELLARSIETFVAAGYVQIGMDHFARPGDDLALAQQAGTLGRNFMGYTCCAAPDLLGLGMSAIGDVQGTLLQNHRRLADYEQAVAAGRLPVGRGYERTAADEQRRAVISDLMVKGVVEKATIQQRFGVNFDEVFAAELQELRELEVDGLVLLHPGRLEVTPLGRRFVRNVAMVFDAYLARATSGGPRFSRTV